MAIDVTNMISTQKLFIAARSENLIPVYQTEVTAVK